MQRQLLLLSFIEGASLLALLFIAMPMKYLAGDPSLVRSVGMIHGILFIALVALIAVVARKYRWPPALIIFALISSSVPFGMIALDRKLKKRAQA